MVQSDQTNLDRGAMYGYTPTKTSLREKIFYGIATLSFVYCSVVAAGFLSNSSLKSESKTRLNQLGKERSQLVGKVNEFNKYIPILSPPFFDQYSDSLMNSMEELREVENKIIYAKKDLEENLVNPWRVWKNLSQKL